MRATLLILLCLVMSGSGQTAPLWRLPPLSSATGEPVLVAHTLSFGTRTCHRLADALRGDGYDVLRFTFVGGKLTFTDVVHGDCDAMSTNVHTTLVKIS